VDVALGGGGGGGLGLAALLIGGLRLAVAAVEGSMGSSGCHREGYSTVR
jgi:hypothetical protein